MKSSKLAHDLNRGVWRSEDVSISTYLEQSGQIEIITPSMNGRVSESSNKNEFLLKNAAADESTFSSIKINKKIVDDLKRCGFVRPSPIQATTIPLGRIGIDLIAQSKSGTGKTIVFVVCALELVINSPRTACPRVLIIAPTREIAVQIGDIVDSLTTTWDNFSCYKAIGGTKVSENISQLATSQIVVGTPGRICCLLENDFLKTDSIRLFVLDECDKLMDDKFQVQINKIFTRLPENKQMIVTSATLSDSMTSYLSNYMKSPALVRLNSDQPALIGVMQFVVQSRGHQLDYLNFESKIEPLLHILKSVHFVQCFVFSNYQTRAKYLYDRLVAEGWKTACMSGDMSQKERLKIIKSFRQHQYRVLVSTDLTSRGIDIDTVNLVINIDVPFDHETYLHRIGRAGRFGSAGIAITIIGKGADSKKFSNFISQFNFEVKELTLPIETNLWDVFYRDRLDSTRLISIDSSTEPLELNPKFVELMQQLADLEAISGVDFEEPDSNFDDEAKVWSDFYQGLARVSESMELAGDLEIKPTDLEFEEEKVALSTDGDTYDQSGGEKVALSVDVSNPETMVNHHDFRPTNSMPTTTSNGVFKLRCRRFTQTFLRPQFNYVWHLNGPNRDLCKYLLKPTR